MNTKQITCLKLSFEANPQRWRDFGVDLVDAGAPAASRCSRSPIARKVLAGRWEEAYKDWLKAGEFSGDSEEPMLAFILATPVTFHRQAPIPIPSDLPKRIWNDAEYKKCLYLLSDVDYWKKCVTRLVGLKKYADRQDRYQLGKLLSENKPEEAEKVYRDNGMEQESMAEHDLALIHTCAKAHGVQEDENRSRQTMWFFTDHNNQQCGPISEFELRALFDSGELSRGSTRVWKGGMPNWESASLAKPFGAVAYDGPMPPPISSRRNV